MSRIFWDTMFFIYLLEGDDRQRDRADHLLRRSRDRGDSLFTSHLAFGELLAGARKVGGEEHLEMLRTTVPEMGFSFLAFGFGAVDTFSRLRGLHKIKVADSIHLACAASAGMDLFLTGDKRLTRLDVPGIQFIADIDTSLL